MHMILSLDTPSSGSVPVIDPLRLRSTCLAPYTCPPSDAARTM
jgi:hypothetical protein